MGSTSDSIESTTTLLLALVRRGFRFTHPRDADGDLLAIQGVRVHHDVVDVVVIRAENEARAVRAPADEPDVLAPATTLWDTSGSARAVLTRLLDLPDDCPQQTDWAHGCWVATRPGHSVWLRASAS